MCTNFLVGTKASGFINGRSMEFGPDLGSKLFFRKAGHRFDGIPETKYRYSWTADYNVVGMNTHNLPLLTDGMNDQGLVTGDLWLPGSAYQKISDPQKGLPIDRFAMWILSKFKTVDEVKTALLIDKEVEVGAPWLVQNLLPLHFPVHDATGASIVIEFIDGAMMVHDNPTGTLTNQPPFPDQLNNLRNYVNLTPWDQDPYWINSADPADPEKGLKLAPTGHGSGMLGLPGDATPPSRFVKAALFSHFANPFETPDEGVMLAFHILNTVDIPHGINKFTNTISAKTESDLTQWVVVKDLIRMVYNVRMYGSTPGYAVDLKNVDWDALDGKQVEIPTGPVVLDLETAIEGGLAGAAEATGPLVELAPSGDPG